MNIFGTFNFNPSRQFDFGKSSDRKAGEAGLQKTASDLYDRSKQTGSETQQYEGSFDIGKLLNQIYQSELGQGETPAGYNPSEQYRSDDLNKAIYDQTLKQAQDPDAYFTSTFQPELMQAQDTINSYYQKRGLLNSGLAIESMGRAGVDLAIKEAQARMASRQTALQNAQAVSQNVYGMGQDRLSNLANLYSTQQQAGLGSLSRQASGATASAGYQAAPYSAQLGSYYGGRAALQALPGQVISAMGEAMGGAGKAAPVPAPGCWVAAEIFGGWYEPKTVSTRKWMATKAPEWFREFYISNGEGIAKFISNKPILKALLKPLFTLFAKWGA